MFWCRQSLVAVAIFGPTLFRPAPHASLNHHTPASKEQMVQLSFASQHPLFLSNDTVLMYSVSKLRSSKLSSVSASA